MYNSHPSLVIGFHGCKKAVANQLVKNPKTKFHPSTNNYDWLGSGMYFWLGNEERAYEYAVENLRRKKSQAKPAVIGAVLDLGYCLNLLEKHHLDKLRDAYDFLDVLADYKGLALPKNHGGKDNLLRPLDCAVIEMLHSLNKADGKAQYDSVKGVFQEGDDLYQNSGFKSKSHVQLSIRNPNCIKGFFWPRDLDRKFEQV